MSTDKTYEEVNGNVEHVTKYRKKVHQRIDTIEKAVADMLKISAAGMLKHVDAKLAKQKELIEQQDKNLSSMLRDQALRHNQTLDDMCEANKEALTTLHGKFFDRLTGLEKRIELMSTEIDHNDSVFSSYVQYDLARYFEIQDKLKELDRKVDFLLLVVMTILMTVLIVVTV